MDKININGLTQEANCEQLDAIAHDYLGVQTSLDDESYGCRAGAEITLASTIKATEGIYSDTKQALMDVGVETVNGTVYTRPMINRNDTVLRWVFSDGTSIDATKFVSLTTAQRESIVGLYCDFRYSTDKMLSDLDSAFIIPKVYLLGTTSIQSMKWANEQTDFKCLTNRTSHDEAMKDYDGNTMTTNILAECSSRSLSCLPATYCRGLSFNIGGVTKYCFFGAYSQIYFVTQVQTAINGVVNNVFGTTPIAINSGEWYTATEYDANSGTMVYNGSFNYHWKNSFSCKILPLIPYNIE